MFNITTKLILSAFEKPKKSKSYELYSTIFLRKKITPITIFMSIKQMGKLLALNQRVWRTFDLSTATKQADGRERPTYTYSIVQNWSRRIECGLFKLDNLYIQPPKCSLVNHACQL
eukprot:scaffold1562_cov93-Skeletonema_dohrnii-CCMP3373.AAC.13